MSLEKTKVEETQGIASSKSTIFNSTRIVLNVGGKKHDVRWKTLERIPNSRLGKIRNAKTVEEILGLCDEIDFSLNEIYFDRPGKSFSSIIDYYRTGKLHAANDMCIISFFEIDAFEKADEESGEIKFSKGCINSRKKIWDVMENPETSLLAKVKN